MHFDIVDTGTIRHSVALVVTNHNVAGILVRQSEVREAALVEVEHLVVVEVTIASLLY